MWHLKYIGIPFKPMGRDENGADCWGLGRIIYKNELNIDLPDLSDLYSSTNDAENLSQIIKEQKENWENVEGKFNPFDFLIIRMNGLPMHVAIVINDKFMIHCHEGADTTVERYNGLKWKDRIIGAVRWKKQV